MRVRLIGVLLLSGGIAGIATTSAGASQNLQAKATASTTISISPSSAPPLATAEVKGSGFDPYSASDVFFETTDLLLAVADGVGNIDVKFQIPSWAQPGAQYVTVEERGSNRAAQTQYIVSTAWPQWGFSPIANGYNLYENTINTGNVSNLSWKWGVFLASSNNPFPFVLKDSYAYVGDSTGHVHAFNGGGQLQWQANPGGNMSSVTPVAYGSNVFFGDASGNVFAYAIGCQHNGSACTPVWTHSVGTSVGGLSVYNAKLYASSSDGKVHPFDPPTGTPGTPFYVGGSGLGALQTPVAFAPDGASFVTSNDGTFAYMQYRFADGDQAYSAENGATFSAPALSHQQAYFTSTDGYLRGTPLTEWAAATSGTGCDPAPAIANNTIYAGGCSTIAAYDPATGAVRWSMTTLGPVTGVSVANGVVYTCEGVELVAYAASNGGRLWSDGTCNGAPEIVNGLLYATSTQVGELDAYSLPGFPKKPPHRPDPLKLKRDLSLKPIIREPSKGKS